MKRILIVDDDAHIGDMLEETLVREGYAVTRAYSGTEALLQWKQARPDLVLLDLMLPKLDGFGVCEGIRARSDVPVVMLTALDGEVDVETIRDYARPNASGEGALTGIMVTEE